LLVLPVGVALILTLTLAAALTLAALLASTLALSGLILWVVGHVFLLSPDLSAKVMPVPRGCRRDGSYVSCVAFPQYRPVTLANREAASNVTCEMDPLDDVHLFAALL
jgi:hypothetical protein